VRTERGRLTACPQSARKAKERSLNRHARGVRRWFPERFGNLVRVPSALDPGEDQLAILRAQRGQPVLVADPGFAADRRLERRGLIGRHAGGERRLLEAAPGAPEFFADPVEQHLTEVGVQRAIATVLEGI
jgi:hypothetical protein